jgi:excisionase family DNA binding protein
VPGEQGSKGNGGGDRVPLASPAASIEELIELVVERAVHRAIGSLLARLDDPAPLVYTLAQAAKVLQISLDTVSGMVRRGVLPQVPHVGDRVLIPRWALDRLVGAGHEPGHPEATDPAPDEPASRRSISSAAPRSDPGMKCL